MASQPGRERDCADATSRRADEIQTAMVSIRHLSHETEFFRRSLKGRCTPRPGRDGIPCPRSVTGKLDASSALSGKVRRPGVLSF